MEVCGVVGDGPGCPALLSVGNGKRENVAVGGWVGRTGRNETRTNKGTNHSSAYSNQVIKINSKHNCSTQHSLLFAKTHRQPHRFKSNQTMGR